MSLILIVSIVIALAVIGYVLGVQRAVSSADGDQRILHSLKGYYGQNVALTVLVPSLLVLAIWAIAQPLLIDQSVSGLLNLEDSRAQSLAMADVRRVAEGLDTAIAQGALTSDAAANMDAETTDVRDLLGDIGVAVGSDVTPETLNAAQRYRGLSNTGSWARGFVVLAIALAGFAFALSRITKDFRARNIVERGVLVLLIAAASVAVLTTIGIVLSLIFNTINFLQAYPAADFFFGTRWEPSFSGRGGSSELGFLPLIWGTMFISIISLIVAVPLGLFSAIYLSEYASPRVRSIAKPMLEILAGIPTIVYGLFALLTVGPLLVSAFGQGGFFGVDWMSGGTAAMTAGLVMGIMLIPFVSSLSDDIINAVPQAMRDGSYGLGATQSETIRQVIIPAALPGIVGAILLAASRAIGETMIVVLGAGAAASLSLNPFEAMTTVTAKIVSQLTGDGEFNSPETMVAFALGMTLFVITLCLNVFALYIVRKYREQYD
ncbi:phosphate ABC transporter permease subunit PstC [Octadecabacter sp. 1_MG-2023]|uniref:phosphate ABC transporter permease subunit PstC n=1 Tax=unclassified Octadecabacter TaxID=196158 RepID=UPI001C08C0C8|nr:MULTISPECIES: phosphate ABC transporter permease subunit PstC [unclassified Octadecabacter]MBU2993290.1 phosphate ABC transporter permease subunit PstC [Octadecabacter sp. B2R22]MDO6733254.1 phosphate ABC transporter permease subunit PstC [Octadecabacter sp. 1_MG-2023]